MAGNKDSLLEDTLKKQSVHEIGVYLRICSQNIADTIILLQLQSRLLIQLYRPKTTYVTGQ